MADALQLGIRSLANAEVQASRAAVARLGGRLAETWGPTRAGLLAATIEKCGAFPDLVPEERAATLGRRLARVLFDLCRPALADLVGVVSAELVAEAERWERLAETIDLLGAPVADGPLLTTVRAMRLRYEQLERPTADAAVVARRQVVFQALLDDVGLGLAFIALREGEGDDPRERVARGLAHCPEGQAARAVFERRAALLLAPLLDAVDHHLEPRAA
jgi:hypothetical protein